MFWDILSRIDSMTGTFAFIMAFVTAYIYFRNPLKRGTFFGYRPTYQIPLYDPEKSLILLGKRKGTEWDFIQGGSYHDGIDSCLQDVLSRRLNFAPNQYYLKYFFQNSKILTAPGKQIRSADNTFSIRRSIIGKIYVTCMTEILLGKLPANYQKYVTQMNTILGVSLEEVRAVTLKEAKTLLMASTDNQERKEKQLHVYPQTFVELEKVLPENILMEKIVEQGREKETKTD